MRNQITLIIAVFILMSAASNRALARSEKTGIEKIFEPDMIGADIGYFEHITGPSVRTYDDLRIYKVDGCEVLMRSQSSVIHEIGLTVTEDCTFDLNKFLDSDRPISDLRKMTFGEFEEIFSNAIYLSDCIYGCGNAADPVLYSYSKGARYNKNLDFMIEGSLPDGKNGWVESMLKDNGDQWIYDKTYNCKPNDYESIIREEKKNDKIFSIIIGRDIKKPECPR
ncbi:MAG TPA: hypothetical protein VN226_00875 [Anaerolineales bacterium]|nr:hypothetical protein [Anaerolineales bacterium]